MDKEVNIKKWPIFDEINIKEYPMTFGEMVGEVCGIS
jgi:hypothetical protein